MGIANRKKKLGVLFKVSYRNFPENNFFSSQTEKKRANIDPKYKETTKEMRDEFTYGEEGNPVSGHLPIHPIIAGGGHGRNTVYCQPVDKRFSYLKLSYLLG